MNYPIPANPPEVAALRQKPVNELLLEILADDSLLEQTQRRWLSEIVAQAWQGLP